MKITAEFEIIKATDPLTYEGINKVPYKKIETKLQQLQLAITGKSTAVTKPTYLERSVPVRSLKQKTKVKSYNIEAIVQSENGEKPLFIHIEEYHQKERRSAKDYQLHQGIKGSVHYEGSYSGGVIVDQVIQSLKELYR